MKNVNFTNKDCYAQKLTFYMSRQVIPFILSLIISIGVSAQELKKITIINDDISFKELFKEIERQTGYVFFYNNSHFDDSKKLTINTRDQSVDQLLKEVLPEDLTFQIGEEKITIVIKDQDIKSNSQSQKKTITGKVVDDEGNELPGVNVVIKETSTGTVTDVDGTYSLSIDDVENAVLVFSYVGYVSEEFQVGDQSIINVTMVQDITALSEVVVIGFGTQKKSDVTGAISSVKSSDLENRSTPNAAKAMQGKVAGVQVMNNSGAPGSQTEVRIRGFSSNGSSGPLYIVDGLKVPNLDYLDSENIESIEVLKDGASAAIYGAEAGNGVVLITTKTGKKGDGRIFFNGTYTLSTLGRKMDLLKADEYINYIKEAGVTDDELDKFYYNDPSSYVNNKLADTDWQDESFTTGYQQRYSLGFEGGNDKGSLFLSLNYLDHDGIVVGSQDTYTRITSQLNASYNFKEWLDVGITNSLEKSKLKQVTESGVTNKSATSMIYIVDPLTPVEYSDGVIGASSAIQEAVANGYSPYQNKETGNYYGFSHWVSFGNPYGLINRDNVYSDVLNVNGTIYANLKPIKNLVVTSRFGYRTQNVYNYDYTPPHWNDPGAYTVDPELSAKQTSSLYYQWENFFNYNLDIKKSTITAMGGMSVINNTSNNVMATTFGLESLRDNYLYLDYSTPAAIDNIGGNTSESAQIAYFGRLSWTHDERYNLQFNYRADSYDAAYLDLKHNWGHFPSVSAGWTISNEPFMRGVNKDFLSFAKLRASYGKNGSISNLGGYMYSSSLVTGNYYYMNGTFYTGIYPNEYLANPKLRWEESIQLDLGLDIWFLNDRLNFTADYFNKNTDGLLIQSASSLITGTSYVFQNVGVVNNQGYEFELEWKDNINNDFKYDIKANLATVTNNVDEYKGEGVRIEGTDVANTDITVTYFEEGYPVWYLRGYKLEGIDQSDGSPIFKDMDSDGIITAEDKTYIGDAIPDFTYGATVTLNYKNFNFLVFGTGSQGASIMYGITNTGNPNLNRPRFFYDERWTSESQNAKRPSALYQTDPKYLSSDAMLFDGSYFKIKQIQLGYNFPGELLEKIKVSSLRAYVSLEDFFTFTSYPGLDPEIRTNSTYSMAVDEGGYPIAKSIMFGLNLSF